MVTHLYFRRRRDHPCRRASEEALVAEMRVQLAAITGKVTDHEARICDVEAAKAKLLGACLLLCALDSASGWVALVVTHH